MIGILLAAAILLPNPALTPGANDLSVVDSSAVLCPHADTTSRRNVTEATKRAVFQSYNVDPSVGGPYEIDHLCSLELGCNNSIKNLWPQSYTTMPWNAHVKDKLEDRLHELACDKTITFDEARKAISTDWIAAYGKYIGPLR